MSNSKRESIAMKRLRSSCNKGIKKRNRTALCRYYPQVQGSFASRGRKREERKGDRERERERVECRSARFYYTMRGLSTTVTKALMLKRRFAGILVNDLRHAPIKLTTVTNVFISLSLS